MAEENKKFFWLKLDRNFFKRHDVEIIRAKGGIEAVYFYLFLLTEALDHNGALRFSPRVPYDTEMLAQLSGVSEETVNKALELFKKYELAEVTEDGTINMLKLANMTGYDTSYAQRKRAYRERKKETEEGQSETTTGQCPTEKEKEKEKESELEKESEKDTFTFNKVKGLKGEKKKTALPDSFEKFEKLFYKYFGYNPADLPKLYEYLKRPDIKDWQAAMISWATGKKAV